MERRTAALALVAVGLVLLPGPAYAAVVDDATGGDERHRESYTLGAERIDPNATAGQRELVRRYGTRVALPVESVTAGYARDDYAAPNRTASVLRAAIENGTAVAAAAPVRTDVAAVADEYDYLRVDRGSDPADDPHYALSVSESETRTIVRADRANRSDVAATVLDRHVVAYDSLSPAERETVDGILAESAEGEASGDYRPYSDEPVPDPPFVLRRGDAYYDVRVTSHVDDFSFPTGFFAGVVASAVGVLSILAGLAVAAVAHLRGD